MKLTCQRSTFTENSTDGELLIDGAHFCWTLEPVYREVPGESVDCWKVQGKTAIPCGIYPVTMRFSPKFRRIMPHIENIPGFSEVMLHPLNEPDETEGCIGVGYKRETDFIYESRHASDDLNARIQAAIDAGNPVTIEVSVNN